MTDGKNKEKVFPMQRREFIRRTLQQKQFLSSSELQKLLNASESTIRRDLELMERNGIVERVHGGAVLTKLIRSEQLYLQSKSTNLGEKEAIANYACSLINSGDVVFFNHGTTVSLIAKELAKRNDLENITVITSNFGVISELKETDIQLVCLGGNFRKNSFSFSGSFTIENLQNYNANVAFLGVDGINLRNGCTFSAEFDAQVSRFMAKQTHGQIHIVADHDKWGTVSEYNCIPLNRASSFITGKQLSEEFETTFEELGVTLHRV